MRTRAKGTSRAAVLAAGFVALGVTAIPSNASADVAHGGMLSGNQMPIAAPVDVSGNGSSPLGTTYATSGGGAKVRKHGGAGQKTSGQHGIASGNQVNAPISLPVNVCGNGAAVLGHADAGCEGGAKVKNGGRTAAGQETSGIFGVGSGNQANAPVTAPADVCGNAAAVVGSASALCQDDPGHGGYDPYYRTTGTALPATDGIPKVGGLNVADGLFTVTGLPARNTRPDGGSVTSSLSEVGGLHAADGLPGVGGLSKVAGLSAANALPGVGGVAKGNGLLGSVANPEILRGARSATPPGGELPVGQGVDGLSSLEGGGAPVAVSLLDTRNLTATATPRSRLIPGGTVLPSSPVVPSVEKVAAGVPAIGRPPTADGIGPVRQVAAEETIGPKPMAGATWTFGFAAMLALVAGALGVTRRFRFGRRRR